MWRIGPGMARLFRGAWLEVFGDEVLEGDGGLVYGCNISNSPSLIVKFN